MIKLIVGIDEVGRGPLAGPVTVGIFVAEKRMGKWLLKNLFHNKLRDSKKLSEKKREEIYNKIRDLQKESKKENKEGRKIFYTVCHISNKIIDKKGISFAINYAIKKNFEYMKHSVFNTRLLVEQVRLDGSLKAPDEFKNQKTIVKGDETDVFIACASIIAKVSRDTLMCRLAKKYPNYDFERHKGYGTKKHRELIKTYGLSVLHRVSFCANVAPSW